MAGWFPMDLHLEDKPKFKVILERLGLDEKEHGSQILVGALYRLWAWMDTTSNEGTLAYATAKMIDRTVGVSGFSDALCSVGWLEIHDQGATMPGFEEHHSSNSKKRIHDAREAAKKRKQGDKPTAPTAPQKPQPAPAKADRPAPPEESRTERDKSREARDENRGALDLDRQTDRQTSSSYQPKGHTPPCLPTEREEEEALRQEGGDWERLYLGVVKRKVGQAASAIGAARRSGFSVQLVEAILAHYDRRRDKLGGPPALYRRLTERGPNLAANEGWANGEEDAKPKPPMDPEVARTLAINRLIEERGISRPEAMAIVDAQGGTAA